MRTDQPGRTGMDYWKGPHSGIISATPGLAEYRQVHLAETNPGRWPATRGMETDIPLDRKIDGVAEVTFQSVVSPLLGRKQDPAGVQGRDQRISTHPAVRRAPNSFPLVNDVAGPNEEVGARSLVYLRRRQAVRRR